MTNRTSSQARIFKQAMLKLLKIDAPSSLIEKVLEYLDASEDKESALKTVDTIIKNCTYNLKNMPVGKYNYSEMESMLSHNDTSKTSDTYLYPIPLPEGIVPNEWKCHHVSDELDYEWEKWSNKELVLISSPTGHGKNWFIEHTLIQNLTSRRIKAKTGTKEYLRKPNILVLSNRIALSMQSKFRIANIVGEQYIHNYNAQGIKECVNKLDSVYVMSYHQYLSLMLAKEQSGFNEEEEQTRSKYLGEFCYVSTLEGITFDYIICDECHFFLQDSLYNSHSECIYNKIFSEHPDAVKIFLTATPMEVLPALTQTSIALSEPSIEQIYNTTGIKLEPFPKLTFYNLKHIEHQYRYNPTELDFINDLPLKIAESFDGYNENDLNPDGSSPKIRPKWLIFVANIKRGKTLCEAIKKKCNNLKIDFISSETKESTKDRHKFYDIVYNEYFEQDVLITTTVLDNGVNLSNPPVTDLALDVFDEVTSIQCCGRVRVHDAVPIINLYLQRYSPKYVSNHLNECKRVIKLFERDRHYPVDIKVAEKFNVPNVWYTDSSNQPQLNKFAETKAIYNFNFFSLCNSEFESNPSVFIQHQFNWLGINKSLLSDIFDQKQEKILAFMKAHRNTLLRDLPENNPIFESDTSKPIKTFSNEFKQLYLELYGPRYEGEKTDSRSYGLDIIKDCLERVGLNDIVKIKSRYKQDTKLDHTIYNVLVFK